MSKLMLGLLIGGIILLVAGDAAIILWAIPQLVQEWHLVCGY